MPVAAETHKPTMSSHFEEIRLRNQDLTNKLLSLTGSEPVPVSEPGPATPPQQADAIVAHIEINDHHGVGVLLRRLFGESPNILSIRSKNFPFGLLPKRNLPPAELTIERHQRAPIATPMNEMIELPCIGSRPGWDASSLLLPIQ